MSHNKASEMATESTSANGTNILSINFDCLDAILSSKCLSIEDLCAIAATHSYLKKVVDSVFSNRHKYYLMNLTDIKEREKSRRILKNFGVFISALSITASRSCGQKIISECLDWVMENCGDTLKSLHLDDLKITKARVIKLKPLFDKLQKISLEYCHVCSGKKLFNNCESLVEFKIGNVKFDNQHAALENTFSKLVRFEYFYGRWQTDSIGHSIWNDFFSRHKNLKALKLRRWQEGTDQLLPMVAYNCKQLEEFDVYIEGYQALSSILALENLNKLQIQYVGDRNITKFIQGLATLKSLEFLVLRFFAGDSEFVAALSKLTRLQSLDLHCRGLTNLNPLGEELNFDLVEMIKCLIRLKILHLRNRSFQMDKRMYLRIVDVLRERPGNLQQTLEISCWTVNDFAADSRFDKILRVTKLQNMRLTR